MAQLQGQLLLQSQKLAQQSHQLDQILEGLSNIKKDMGHDSDSPNFPVRCVEDVRAMDRQMRGNVGFSEAVVRIKMQYPTRGS